MPFAVTLRLDPASASGIEAMWEVLAAADIDSDRRDLGYAPHVTLAILPDEVPVAPLRAAVGHVVRRWTAMPVVLSGFGVFPVPMPVLWAAPVVTEELLSRHAELVRALSGLPVHPHYQVGAWVPHVTLTAALRDPARALAALLPLWRPVAGMLMQVDLLRFRPVSVLESHVLVPAGSGGAAVGGEG